MYTYKKFTVQDYAVVPFNAHKQYSYGSSSAASNRVTHFNTQWTSESISLYSSSSAYYGGDTKNVIKYNQIDHLFYRDFLTNHANLFGNFNYLKHKRNLYEKANIISIPTGLYGQEIKPGSFYLSSSNQEVIDDTYGNLIISGTDVSNYPTDVRSNVFRLDPIKGFKNYDLSIFEDYALKLVDPQHPEAGTYKVFWKKGRVNPNFPKTYSTHEDLQEIDDSYFLNTFKYQNVNFQTSSLGSSHHKFPSITFNSATGSRVLVHHDERFNFDKDDNFSVSFYMEPRTLFHTPPDDGIVNIDVKYKLQGGYIFNITDDYAYIVKPELQTPNFKEKANTNNATSIGTGATVNSSNKVTFTADGGVDYVTPIAINMVSGRQYLISATISGYSDTSGTSTIGFSDQGGTGGGGKLTGNGTISHQFTSNGDDIKIFAAADVAGVMSNISVKEMVFWGKNSNLVANTPSIYGEGETTTAQMASGSGGTPLNEGYLGHYLLSTKPTVSGFSDWWLPNETELDEIITQLTPFSNPNFTGKSGNQNTASLHSDNLLVVSNDDGLAASTQYKEYDSSTSTYVLSNKNAAKIFQYLLVRKVNLKKIDSNRRDIIGKSTTKTVVPSPMAGTSEILNPSVSGNMQPIDIVAESQFPFEIYMKSGSIYFDRADTFQKHSINCYVTGSDGHVSGSTHILCQKSASRMEIHVNGELKAEGDATLYESTRNRANLYIGSKGNTSVLDESLTNSSFRYFNGKLSNINIWEIPFTTTKITNISESINTSPYIGNIFYQNGFATITHPKYHSILGGLGIGEMVIEDGTSEVEDGVFVVDSEFYHGINKIEFQGTHKITEHEYQCTVDEHEYNSTMNISARKSISDNIYELANFTTGSMFKPYITTIGLYNEQNDLLVIGKLNQPIRTSNETDTTFIVRWDT